MPLLLDTNVAIHLRDGDPVTSARLAQTRDVVFLSIVTRVELEGGVWRTPEEAQVRRARLDVLLGALPVLPFEDTAAEVYGRIVQAAGYSRRKLLDRMIAAQAMVVRATLVTRNAADFSDIPGLALEVW